MIKTFQAHTHTHKNKTVWSRQAHSRTLYWKFTASQNTQLTFIKRPKRKSLLRSRCLYSSVAWRAVTTQGDMVTKFTLSTPVVKTAYTLSGNVFSGLIWYQSYRYISGRQCSVLVTSCKISIYGCGNPNIYNKKRSRFSSFFWPLVGRCQQEIETVFRRVNAMSSSVRNRVRKSISKSVKGSACKFRFTVTYEYVDLKCNNRW